MNQRSLAILLLAGAWAVLLLFFLFRLGSAISGQYTMNWSQELAVLTPIVITSAGALTILTRR